MLRKFIALPTLLLLPLQMASAESTSRTVLNKRWVLDSRPNGKFSSETDARFEEELVSLDDLEEGESIVQARRHFG